MSEPPRDFLAPMTDLVLLFAAHGLATGSELLAPSTAPSRAEAPEVADAAVAALGQEAETAALVRAGLKELAQ